MSYDYAASLSKYPNKGILGLPETQDDARKTEKNILELARLVQSAKHVVVHTGAGLSTSAGIPDFRGPNGVWTAERKKRQPPPSKSFTEIIPTVAHMALKKLVDVGTVAFIVSQNIDGLHLRSGIPGNKLAELHGNVFREVCRKCRRLYLRNSPCPTLGMKPTGDVCDAVNERTGFPCRGILLDMVLDWRNKLPETDLAAAESHCRAADLNLVLGSTLQIVPAAELPFRRKEDDPAARTVICNLQKTKFDDKMDLIIRCKLDTMLTQLMAFLNLEIPTYESQLDPVLAMTSTASRTSFFRDYHLLPIVHEDEHPAKSEEIPAKVNATECAPCPAAKRIKKE